MSDLTPKQACFVGEYLIDLNATQAAIRAGYSERSAKQLGSRLLTNADVQTAVAKDQAEKAEKLGLSQEWVLRRLVQVVERCLQAEAVVDRKGEPVIIETPEGEMGATYTFQAAGAIRALELLGKHLNLFNETVKHEPEPGHTVHVIPESEIRDEIEEMFRGPSFSRAHQDH